MILKYINHFLFVSFLVLYLGFFVFFFITAVSRKLITEICLSDGAAPDAAISVNGSITTAELGAQDQRLGAEQDQLPCGSTGTSSGICQETDTRMVRACHTPRQPLQNRRSGRVGGWATT